MRSTEDSDYFMLSTVRKRRQPGPHSLARRSRRDALINMQSEFRVSMSVSMLKVIAHFSADKKKNIHLSV